MSHAALIGRMRSPGALPRARELTDIGSVDEAEEIQDRDRGDDEKIDLGAQARFGLGIELEQRLTVPLPFEESQLSAHCLTLWK